ncbi:MAG: hypothetical protein QOH08_1023 [Chloroflexota bacterium]|jgi:hypothetical protein|nr:hypothetical protein [Chloroflexota bacterium]
MTRILSIAAAIAVVVVSLSIFASPAAAHERRTVGPYTFVVGWINEPAYVNQLNALDLTVTETASTKAVEGLEKTLKADLVAGGGSATMALTVAARFGLPGKYQGQVVPTKVGDYTFHITGTVGTMAIDEKFESGPGRFGAIEDIAPLQFPSKLPSAGDLAARLDDANAKLNIAIALGAIALIVSIASLVPALRRR